MSANVRLNVIGETDESVVTEINRAIEAEVGGDGHYDRLLPRPVQSVHLVGQAFRDDPVEGWRYRNDLLMVDSLWRAHSPAYWPRVLHVIKIIRDRLPDTATLYWSNDEREGIGDEVTDELLDRLQQEAGDPPSWNPAAQQAAADAESADEISATPFEPYNSQCEVALRVNPTGTYHTMSAASARLLAAQLTESADYADRQNA